MRLGWGIPLPGPFWLGGTIWRSGRSRRSHRPDSRSGCLPWLLAACVLSLPFEYPWLWPPIGFVVLWVAGVVIVRGRQRRRRGAVSEIGQSFPEPRAQAPRARRTHNPDRPH